MKRIALLAMLFVSALGYSQGSSNATATSNAIIVSPLKVVKVNDLNFGKIIGSAAGGNVSIAADAGGARTIDSDMDAPTSDNQAASFEITGGDETYTITLEATDLTATNETDMVLTPETNLSGTTSSGTQTIYVGGTLAVNPNQGAATYEGDVKVTVSYE